MTRPGPSLSQRARSANPLPEGAIAVGTGLLVSGVATYVFLAIASHSLDEQDYSALGVFWSLLFAVGNGLMQPLEQEVARTVSERRARGVGVGPVIRRAATIGLSFTVAGVAVAVVLHDFLIEHLFDGNTSLLVLFLVGMFGFCIAHLVRGVLSSHGRFGSYGLMFGVDGFTRFALAGVLAAIGVAAVGPYAFAAVAAVFLGALVAVIGQRSVLDDGPEAPWSELSSNLGWLLLGIGSIAFVLNAGPIAVQVLAGPEEEQAAGVFLNALNLARVPLFLFQAVLAALLPKLSHQLGRGAYHEFSVALRRLLAAITALGVVAIVVAAAIGPTVVGALFGTEEVLAARDFALLAAFSGLFMVALTLGQGLVAMNDHARVAAGAVLGALLFVAVVSVGGSLYTRVELALLAGAATMVVWNGAFLWLGVRDHHVAHELDLADELAELPLQT